VKRQERKEKKIVKSVHISDSKHVKKQHVKLSTEYHDLRNRLIGSCINYGFHHYPIGGHPAAVHSAPAEAAGGIKSTEIWL